MEAAEETECRYSHTHVQIPQHTHGGQRATLRNLFSPFIMHVQESKLSSFNTPSHLADPTKSHFILNLFLAFYWEERERIWENESVYVGREGQEVTCKSQCSPFSTGIPKIEPKCQSWQPAKPTWATSPGPSPGFSAVPLLALLSVQLIFIASPFGNSL